MTPFFKSHVAQTSLFNELESWRDTKFAENQCVKGVGVDCVRFAAAALANVGAIRRLHWPRYALRGVGKAGEEMILKVIREQIPNMDVLMADEPGLPGDVLLLRDKGITHAAVAGRWPQVWHCAIRYGVTEANLTDPVIARAVAFRFRAYL